MVVFQNVGATTLSKQSQCTIVDLNAEQAHNLTASSQVSLVSHLITLVIIKLEITEIKSHIFRCHEPNL